MHTEGEMEENTFIWKKIAKKETTVLHSVRT